MLEPQAMPSPAVGRFSAPLSIQPQDKCSLVLSQETFSFIFFSEFFKIKHLFLSGGRGRWGVPCPRSVSQDVEAHSR